MKICGEGRQRIDGVKSGAEWGSLSLLPLQPPRSALALLTAPVSSFSVEMRPLRRLQGGDAEVSRAGCVTGDEVSPYPTSVPNSKLASPITWRRVWDPGESLARGTESVRGR